MKDCCIVIHYHKHELSNSEIVSLCRLYNMFNDKYDIMIISNEEGLNYFYELLQNNKLLNKYSDDLYLFWKLDNDLFFTIEGYNTLLMFIGFYKFFMSKYKYIFIYHLDCYIFKDELDYWINRDQDHIECINSQINKIIYNGQGLRKISSCINALNNLINLLNIINHLSMLHYLYQYGYWINNITFSEDDLFTLILNNGIVDEDHFRFGYSFDFKNNYLKYGLPMMIHYFGRNRDNDNDIWLKEIIGDWETDPEACINKLFD